MNRKQKKMLMRIIAAALLMIVLHFMPVTGLLRFILYLVPYFVIGYDILIKAAKGIKNRQVFDECFLMAVATIGAIALALTSDGDYTEAIAVMLFYQIGEWFQSYAVGKSRRNISELMDIRPDYANLEVDGRLEQTDPDEIEIGKQCVEVIYDVDGFTHNGFYYEPLKEQVARYMLYGLLPDNVFAYGKQYTFHLGLDLSRVYHEITFAPSVGEWETKIYENNDDF